MIVPRLDTELGRIYEECRVRMEVAKSTRLDPGLITSTSIETEIEAAGESKCMSIPHFSFSLAKAVNDYVFAYMFIPY